VMKVFQPVQSVVPPTAVDRVIGPSNQPYIGALGQLQIAIDQTANQPPPAEAATGNSMQTAGQARQSARTIEQGFTIDQEGRVHMEVGRLLEEPITWAENLLRGAAPADLNAKGRALCAQIHPVLAKFPFTPGSPAQATLPEINQVFKPQDGVIWKFVQDNLSKVVTRIGSRYSANPSGGVKISDQFLAFLNRSAAFSDAAYTGGSADPHFNYAVRPEPSGDLENVTIVIDGQTADFPGGAGAAKPFVWPGPQHGVLLSVKFKGGGKYQINKFEGLWAVFEWADQADQHTGTLVEFVLGSGRPKRPVTDEATGKNVAVRLNLDANPPIFDKGYFTVTCSANVAR